MHTPPAVRMALPLLWALISSHILAAPASPGDLVECQFRGGLANTFEKLQAGATVRIDYLGGSITAQDGWRPKSLKWFQGQFPAAKVSEINAAIGGIMVIGDLVPGK